MRKKIMYAALGAVLVWTLGGCQKAPEVKEEQNSTAQPQTEVLTEPESVETVSYTHLTLPTKLEV